MDLGLRDAKAVVVGGSRGMGRASAQCLADDGARVAVIARSQAQLDDVIADLARRGSPDAVGLVADVTDAAQVVRAVRRAEKHFGGIDVVVNNAGRGHYGSIEGSPDSVVRGMFELNFFAALAVVRAALPAMRARRSGWIINVSSLAALRDPVGFGYYSAAKSALTTATEVLREELAPWGIHVMSVLPGAFRTQAYAQFADEPIRESVDGYGPALEEVRAAMIAQDGNQPGDPLRGARAVLAAMAQNPPPSRLILGGEAYDVALDEFSRLHSEATGNETLSRAADFPTDVEAGP